MNEFLKAVYEASVEYKKAYLEFISHQSTCNNIDCRDCEDGENNNNCHECNKLWILQDEKKYKLFKLL